jgi:hypothetical protein
VLLVSLRQGSLRKVKKSRDLSGFAAERREDLRQRLELTEQCESHNSHIGSCPPIKGSNQGKLCVNECKR